MSSLVYLVRLWDYHEQTHSVAFSAKDRAKVWAKWANRRLATKLPSHKDQEKVFWQVDEFPTHLDDPTYPNHLL